MSEQDQVSEQARTHPVQLLVADDLRRSRLTVLLRLILVIPHLLWLYAFSLATFFVAIVQWFAALITGRPQSGMHDFLARYVRYYTHLTGYMYLVANPYPRFLGVPATYPVDLELPPPEPQHRLVTGFRLVLAIPAAILSSVFSQVLAVVALLGWFVSLAIGRMPKGMRDLSAYCLRYQGQTYAYVLLVTQRYPSLSAPAL